MIIDPTGWMAADHVREMRRTAAATHPETPHRHSRRLRDLAARTQLGPSYNYRSR